MDNRTVFPIKVLSTHKRWYVAKKIYWTKMKPWTVTHRCLKTDFGAENF